MKLGLISAVGATIVLSACGGSSSSENVDASVTLDQLKDRAAVARNTFELTPVDEDGFQNVIPVEPNQVPARGELNYTGIAAVISGEAFNDAADDVITLAALGSSTMTVNFDTQVITGSANNFFELDNPQTALSGPIDTIQAVQGQRIDGSLTYRFDQRADGQNFYTGTVSGTLFQRNGEQLDLAENMEGFFSGTNGRGFFGSTSDDIIVDELDSPGVPFNSVGLLMTRDN
ncbi:hypothetical protein [Yoonia vestfoldensis]|uniref:hypothetical protein n=1 Tax=Yoonia vestfoldensis TaxID=245188 RepID=UPI000371A0CD|nr:hypothetical protein [Yoonia vestfoldensis]